ncbi:MAG: RrF2 family transcriptional regulator [Anaerolineae bacterium]
MLRIRRETDYAIRILLALARRDSREPVSTEEVRQEMQIPRQYAPRVVARLAQGGFVETMPGRGGGIRLARPAAEITLKDVVLYFEPVFVISECVNHPASCPFGDACAVRRQWCRLQALILEELASATLAALAAGATPPPTSASQVGLPCGGRDQNPAPKGLRWPDWPSDPPVLDKHPEGGIMGENITN